VQQSKLEDMPKDEKDIRLSEELEDSFPASDPPTSSEPGGGITGAEDPASNDERTSRIRERAYEIWMDEGQVHGSDEEHWRQAEREIDAKDAKTKA
jgi:hypothetical protein